MNKEIIYTKSTHTCMHNFTIIRKQLMKQGGIQNGVLSLFSSDTIARYWQVDR